MLNYGIVTEWIARVDADHVIPPLGRVALPPQVGASHASNRKALAGMHGRLRWNEIFRSPRLHFHEYDAIVVASIARDQIDLAFQVRHAEASFQDVVTLFAEELGRYLLAPLAQLHVIANGRRWRFGFSEERLDPFPEHLGLSHLLKELGLRGYD
jgi:hypothetical protein